MVWSIQDAKNKFSEVVERARTEGPQRVQRHGKEAVMVVSYEEWIQLKSTGRSLADFFAESPLGGVEIEIARDTSSPRNVEL